MSDYTTSESGNWGAGLFVALGIVVLFVLYLVFAGGGVAPNDPAALSEPAAAPAAEETAPAASN